MLKLALIFSDHMVIQRDKIFYIWGQAKPLEKITVRVQGQSGMAIAGSDGHWRAALEPLQTSENEEITVAGEYETLVIHNVAVGEVWLAGGQSNMEFFMRYEAQFHTASEVCENPSIRMFDYPEVSYEGQLDCADYSKFGFWRPCDAQNLEYYPAVAYYFAKEIYDRYHIPVGIVGCNYGGTPAASWMDEKSLAASGKIWMDEYVSELFSVEDISGLAQQEKEGTFLDRSDPFADEISERLMYGVSRQEQQEILVRLQASHMFPAVQGPAHPWRPCGVYYTMLKKIIPYGVRGVLWYQGESDEKHAEIYDKVFAALIKCWRSEWREELPFIAAHLAPFEEGIRYWEIREAQERVARQEKGVYIVTTGDVGMAYDLHPKEKAPVGYRMSLMARHYIYGEDILCEAPEASDFCLTGNILKIHMRNTGDALYVQGEMLEALELYDENASLIPGGLYKAEVEDHGLRIELKHREYCPGMEIRFACAPFFRVNLYNEAGIPAKPFRYTVQEVQKDDR